MARDFGTVRRDARPGRRRQTWLIDCHIDGRRYKLRGFYTRGGRRVAFTDEQGARQALEEIRADIRNGVAPGAAVSDFLPAGDPESRLERYYRRFCEAKARQGAEGQDRQLSAKRIDELWGHERRGHLAPLLDLPLRSISYGALEDWRDWLFGLGLSACTVHHVVGDVGTCLRWLARRGELEGVPELPGVRVPDYAPKIPTPDAQGRILGAIPWERRGLFLARGLMGLRPSEANRANLEDYDFERDLLTVYGKGGRIRYLPADAEVARWVHEHHEAPPPLRAADAPQRPLFPNPRAPASAMRWSAASARREMLSAMRRVGLRFKPNEALRHAFGTGAANRGVGLDRVGFYMGHTETRTTRRYAKLAGEGLVDVTPNCPRTVPAPESGS